MSIRQGNQIIATVGKEPTNTESKAIDITYAEYQQLEADGNVQPDVSYYITDAPDPADILDDTTISNASTFSSEKIESTFYTKDEIDRKISAVFVYKGTKTSISNLPTDAHVGDVYNVEGVNYVYNGSTWDTLGSSIDLSEYYTKNEIDTTINNTTSTLNTTISSVNSKVDTVNGELDTKIDTTKAELEAKITGFIDDDTVSTEKAYSSSKIVSNYYDKDVVDTLLDTKQDIKTIIPDTETITGNTTVLKSLDKSITVGDISAYSNSLLRRSVRVYSPDHTNGYILVASCVTNLTTVNKDVEISGRYVVADSSFDNVNTVDFDVYCRFPVGKINANKLVFSQNKINGTSIIKPLVVTYEGVDNSYVNIRLYFVVRNQWASGVFDFNRLFIGDMVLPVPLSNLTLDGTTWVESVTGTSIQTIGE